ncbi:MAG: rubrerythrin family protein [candidate division Zixibacteria bacterium]
MKTDDNLKVAFEGECKAYMKYNAFARAAEKEGQGQIAKLFRALAEAEKVHALNHFAVMGESGKVEQNTTSAIDGETYEFTQMYPAFIRQAEQDSHSRAAASFRGASAVEKIHGGLLSDALASLGRSKEEDYYVCTICGNTVRGAMPDKCAVCRATSDKFRFVE